MFKTKSAIKKIIILLSTVTLLLTSFNCFGATYYVDASIGNDSNTGTSEATPWRTITKVNASTFNPGDQILFKGGEIWREQLKIPSSGTSNSPVSFSAYGDGKNPIFSGSDIVSNWEGGGDHNVWKANLPNEPQIVIFNDRKLNENNSATNGVGSNEWDWDSGKLYVNVGENPNNGTLEAGQRAYCIFSGSNRDYIIIDNLELKHSNISGIKIFKDANYWIVKNSTIHDIGNHIDETGDGIAHYGSDSIFRKNIIYENGHSGISCFNSNSVNENNIIEYNKIYDCYHNLVEVHGLTNGIIIQSIDIRYNIIYCSDSFIRAGVNAVFVRGNNSYKVENIRIYGNLIHHTTGAGIMSGTDVHNLYIFNNVIYKTRDNGSQCIYLAKGVNHAFVKNNIGMNGESRVIKVSDSTNKTIDYNCWYQAFGECQNIAMVDEINYIDFDEYLNSTGFDTNSIWGSNPLFTDVSSRDFTLKDASLCIDSGVNAGLIHDYAGNPIPQGTGPDIGAYEYREDTNSLPPPVGIRIIENQ